MRSRLAFLVLFALPALAGTAPKEKATDYPVSATLPALSIGAEYLVHSFSGGGQTYVAPDYLVVEVALFSPARAPVSVSSGQFSLRINGKKHVLLPQAPSFVAASLKYTDWERKPTLVAAGGVGDAEVILGRPRPTERFPGDPTGRNRLPRPPQAPPQEDRSGVDKPPPVPAEQLVVEAALPEGDCKLPVSGFLYFAFKGKIKSIKSLDLTYAGPAGTTALKLQ